jgi:cell division protein ZapA
MTSRAVDLSVAGTRCRVVTTAADDELRELARMVEEKLAGVLKPGKPLTMQAVLLAAIALAHEVRTERGRGANVAGVARAALEGLLARVDAALEETSDGVEPSRKPSGASAAAPATRAPIVAAVPASTSRERTVPRGGDGARVPARRGLHARGEEPRR